MKKRIAWMLVLALLLSQAACQRMPGSEIDMKSSTVPIDTAEATEATAEDATGKGTTEEATQRQTTADQKEPTEPETEADTEKPTGNTAGNTQNENTGDKTGGKTDPAHQHSFQTTTVAATCNEQGYTKHTCSCGYSYADSYTAKLGHHFVDEVVAPTSSEQGYTKHTCDRCWYSYKDSYTNPVKVVYDIEAAMAAGNAYALSIGFGYINYSLTPENAGYYPAAIMFGEWMGDDGQSWLEQEMIGKAQSLFNNLSAIRPEFVAAEYGVRAYITYDSSTDTYTCYFLY